MADDIEKLVATGVPVLVISAYFLKPSRRRRIQKFGREREEAEDLYTDAIAFEEAGCFAVIAEMMDEDVASELSKQILPLSELAGGCDGQIFW